MSEAQWKQTGGRRQRGGESGWEKEEQQGKENGKEGGLWMSGAPDLLVPHHMCSVKDPKHLSAIFGGGLLLHVGAGSHLGLARSSHPSFPSTAVARLLSSRGFAKRGPNCCLVDGNLSNVPAAADLRRATREPSLGYLYLCALGCSRPSLVRPCWRLLNATPNAAEHPSSANDAGHSLRVCPGCFAAPG